MPEIVEMENIIFLAMHARYSAMCTYLHHVYELIETQEHNYAHMIHYLCVFVIEALVPSTNGAE